MNRKQMTLDKWQEEGKKLFGENFKNWKFQCIKCGNVQSINSIKEHNKGIKFVDEFVFFSCEGRLNSKFGCDWTLGGLFQIHKIEVMDNGYYSPVFDFFRGEN